MPRGPGEYLDSLRDGRVVYYRGKAVSDVTTHPIISVAAKHAADLFGAEDRLYDDPNYGKISRYFKIPRSTNDLIDRHRLIYNDTMRFDGMFNIVQAIGSDALFSLMIIARKVDTKYGTHYLDRVMKYYEYVVKNDLAMAVTQTDVKGDRSKRPHEQPDPDLYVRVVEVRDDGIVVNGAKIHTTQGPVANEIVFLPIGLWLRVIGIMPWLLLFQLILRALSSLLDLPLSTTVIQTQLMLGLGLRLSH